MHSRATTFITDQILFLTERKREAAIIVITLIEQIKFPENRDRD